MRDTAQRGNSEKDASMLTIKQIETFFWVAKLGTLQRAADKLHITQSAATKRLQEMGARSAVPLFDGTSKKSSLTAKGREVLEQCERLLDSIGRLEEVGNADQHIARVLHIGVTDLVVLTWFPKFMREMSEYYPDVTIQPEIDLSGPLKEKVIDGRLDLAFLPEPELPSSMARLSLGRAQFAWFCPPRSFNDAETISLHELAKYRVIEQSAKSIITVVSSRMFDAIGIDPVRIYGGNNVVALSGLIEAGVGASCLPIDLFARQVREGRMQMVRTNPPAPSISYDAVFLKNPHSALGYAVADIAKRCCDFSRSGLDGEGAVAMK
jgi:DNA-binding transcriptional LysR family regulator